MKPVQLSPKALHYLREVLYYCYLFASSLLSLISYPWTIVSIFGHTHYPRTSPEGEQWYDINKHWASSADVKFTSLDHNKRVRIVAWNLIPFTQREGVIDGSLPRDTELNQWNRVCHQQFHVLTSAHLVWDQELGPAAEVVLYLDERQKKPRIKCVAVACHASLAEGRKWQEQDAKNDFCMVALDSPLSSGVRILRCHDELGPFCYENGSIVGFPNDMPFETPNRRLISSKGQILCHEEDGILSIEHKISTAKGNSGSPVIAESLVVGVHSGIGRGSRNVAAPINRNGNIVDDFSYVLRHIRGQRLSQPKGVEEVKVTRGVTNFGRVLRLFT
ncbi:hypothetical protein F5X98DRAFT_388144 [Xylaria grammica]|nr:hypothetical protein F5X98DRAFT_388144 [Xylaria grammica]